MMVCGQFQAPDALTPRKELRIPTAYVGCSHRPYGLCRLEESLLPLLGTEQKFLGSLTCHYTDFVHSFSILSDDTSKASSKTIPPYSSAIYSFLLQMRVSSPVLKVIIQ